eukprot:m.314031 g.314031  ORF g.314031 m.314031 type:complete len:58 (-) comp55416_c0_seq14:140-313(-)
MRPEASTTRKFTMNTKLPVANLKRYDCGLKLGNPCLCSCIFPFLRFESGSQFIMLIH